MNISLRIALSSEATGIAALGRETFYEKWEYSVEYVGHPLIEIIDQYKLSLNKEQVTQSLGIPTGKKIIALLPGSRKQEIAKKLPIMLESSNDFPEALFVVAQAPGISDDFITAYTNKYTNVKLIKNKTYDLLSIADAALGTTIEIPTIDGGRAKIKIPDGTQSGKQFRLKGKGMPYIRGSGNGDLYVQVNTEVPISLNKAQKELLEKFREIENEKSNPSIKKFFQKAKSFWKN